MSGTVQLEGIGCWSATNCVAVGQTTALGGVVVPITSGAIGTPVSVTGANNFLAVSCVAGTTTCEAVGNAPAGDGATVTITNGVPGTEASTSSPATLDAVSCTSASACEAGGRAGLSTAVVVPITSGTPGAVTTVPGVPSGTGVLNTYAVSCTSAGNCEIGGGDGSDDAWIDSISGGAPGTATSLAPTTRLVGIVCGGSICQAVTQHNATFAITGGSAGTVDTTNADTTNYKLDNLTCPSTTASCISAGYDSKGGREGAIFGVTGNVATAGYKIAGTSELFDVACPSTGVCFAVGGDGTNGLVVTLSAPTVATNPTSVSVTVGQAATFTAAANTSVPPATVQWEESIDGGTTFIPILGATSTTLAAPSTALSDNGDEFEAVFTNPIGSATTTAATLTVTSGTTVPGAPKLTAATAGNGQVVLTWTDPSSNGGSPITSYAVFDSTSSHGESTSSTPACTASGATATTCTATGLTNGTKYFFEVVAINAIGDSAFSNQRNTTPSAGATVPGAPTLVSAASGNATVTLTWTDPSSNGGSAISSYAVFDSTTSGGEDSSGAPACTASGATATSCMAGSLTNGTPYFFVVVAINAIGDSDVSNELSTTPATVAGAPTLTAATPGNAQVSLTWTDPASNGGAPIASYAVYDSTTSNGESTSTAAACTGTGATATTCTVTSLANGTPYFFKVVAINALGKSALSNELSATPVATTVPGAPTLTAATAGAGSVAVTWTDPSSNGGSAVTGYAVFDSTTTGGESTASTAACTVTGPTATTCTATTLTAGTPYFFKAVAINAIGDSALSNELSATPYTVPGAPTLTVATPGNTTVALTWTDPSSNGGSAITSYSVFDSTTTGGESTASSAACTISGATATTCTAMSLTNGMPYFFKVVAINAAGDSVLSNELSATPFTVPNAPTLSTAAPGNGQITLTWIDPSFNGGSAITSYDLYCMVGTPNTALPPGGTVSGATATTGTVSGLTNGTTYTCGVTAVNAAGQSVLSNTLMATPVIPSKTTLFIVAPTTPGGPIGITATVTAATPTPGAPTPTGTVRFVISGVTCAGGSNTLTLVSGAATCTFSTTTGVQVKAIYSGSMVYGPSTSPTELMGPANLTAPVAVWVGSINAWTLDSQLYSGAFGAPAGDTVTFTSGGVTLCSATTDTQGVATCQVSPSATATPGAIFVANFAGNTFLLPTTSANGSLPPT